MTEIEDVKNRIYEKKILQEHSVSLHVRRGDYVNLGWSMEAMHYKLFIEKFMMQLMSMCEGMIFSNSAFCYLAALLNTRRKIVINPTKREL